MIKQKIVIMAGRKQTDLAAECIREMPGLEILEAADANQAFDYIYTHRLVLVIIDQTLPGMDLYKFGAMLLSHRQVYSAPLLILSEKSLDEKFLLDFNSLIMDCLIKPFAKEHLSAKLTLFFELFKQKEAVRQSIDELDRLSKNMVAQHDMGIQPADVNAKDRYGTARAAVDQIQQTLRILQGSIFRLLARNHIPQEIKPGLSAIRTASEQMSTAARNLAFLPGQFKRPSAKKIYRIVYILASDEDFDIFSHILKGIVRCDLHRALSIGQAVDLISSGPVDLIFSDLYPAGGTGFDLLSRLKRMRSDTPVTFTLDQSQIQQGPKLISSGAAGFLAKETLSAAYLSSVILNTLEKKRVTKQVGDIRNRISVLARRDYLTGLYNRNCFEQELKKEIVRAKRYRAGFSVLMVTMDMLIDIEKKEGRKTADSILTSSALIMQGMVRQNDTICRFDDHIFSVILPNTPEQGAGILAQRIRDKLSRNPFDDLPGFKLPVRTVVTCFDPLSDTTLPGFIKQALGRLENKEHPLKTH